MLSALAGSIGIVTEIPYGLCECGCGEPTSVPQDTNRRIGRIKGVPMRYVSGHNGRGKRFREGPDWAEEDRGYSSPCRIWQHKLTKAGYGRATDPSRPGGQQYIHILAWEATHGPVPEGLEIDHLCRQRDCGNVEHLEAVTHAENVRRGAAGAASAALQAAKTHCPKGHPYSGSNLYVCPRGKRHCRTCRRDGDAAARLRRQQLAT